MDYPKTYGKVMWGKKYELRLCEMHRSYKLQGRVFNVPKLSWSNQIGQLDKGLKPRD